MIGKVILPKLLIYSDDYREITGFAKEIKPLLPYLSKVFDVYYLAVFGVSDCDLPVKTYGAATINKDDIFGEKRLQELIEQIKPDVVFANQDLQVIDKYVAGPCNKFKIPLVNWSIIDCSILPESFFQLCMSVDKHVYQTKFTKKAITDSILYLKHTDNNIVYPPVSEEFFKIKKTESNERKRILVVAKNIPRKFITTIIDATELLRDYDNKFEVVIHTQYLNQAPTIDLVKLIKYKRLKNVIFSYAFLDKVVWEDNELAELYASSDLFLSTSGREGVGIPFLESMAVGIPCAGVDHSAVTELLEDKRGVLFKPGAYQYEAGSSPITNAIVSPTVVASMIKDFVEGTNKELNKHLEISVENGFKFVDELRPNKVAVKITKEIMNCLEEQKKNTQNIKVIHLM